MDTEVVVFTRWPGIDRVSDRFLRCLYYESKRRGWSWDDLSGHIAVESGFRPDARAPNGTATGLIQLIEQSAAALGTSTRALARMTPEEQLPFVFAYFDRTAPRGRALAGADYRLLGIGHNAINLSSDAPLFRVGSREYDWNRGLDLDEDGVITPGEIQEHFRRVKAGRTGTRRVTLEGFPEGCEPPERARGGWAAAVIGLVGLGYFARKYGR